MKLLRSKLNSLFLTVILLATIISSSFFFPHTAMAQATGCDTTLPLCIAVQAACLPSTIYKILGGNPVACQYLAFQLSTILFGSPTSTITPTPPPWYNPDLKTFQQKVFDQSNPDEIFGERYTYAQVVWIIDSLESIVVPPALSVKNPLELVTKIVSIIDSIKKFVSSISYKSNTEYIALEKNLNQYGLVGQVYSGMISFNRLVRLPTLPSGVQQVKNLASKLSLVSPAYAQGVGYNKLQSSFVYVFWQATRNIAYLLSVVIIIASAFMIMLRSKINPQTVVTVQMIIPRIFITLILVTFSFALAGFIIDLSYVLISLVLGLLYLTYPSLFTGLSGLNDAIKSLAGNFDFVSAFLTVYIVIAVIIILIIIIVAILSSAAVMGNDLQGAMIIPLIAAILGFFMWSVYVWVRIIGLYITAYLQLMLMIIAGPIMIITDILPRRGGSYSGTKKWIMCVAGQVSVFVSFILLALLGTMLFRIAFIFSNPIPGMAEPPIFQNTLNAGFSMPGWISNYPFTGPIAQFFNFAVFVGYLTICPQIVASIRNMFCKSGDFSGFMENVVKDTVGQVTRTGENLAKTGQASLEATNNEIRGHTGEMN